MTTYKTPPAKSQGATTGQVYVFEKQSGTVGSTFSGRIVSRVPLNNMVERGATITVARYGGKLWRVYPPEIFEVFSRRWVKDGDLVYGEGDRPLRLPLTVPFMFDADVPYRK